jgi:hypothetical protein
LKKTPFDDIVMRTDKALERASKQWVMIDADKLARINKFLKMHYKVL